MPGRGLVHMVPTYASRDQGSLVPTALAGRHLFLAMWAAMTTLTEQKAEARKQAARQRKMAHDILKDEAPLALMAYGFPVQPSVFPQGCVGVFSLQERD